MKYLRYDDMPCAHSLTLPVRMASANGANACSLYSASKPGVGSTPRCMRTGTRDRMMRRLLRVADGNGEQWSSAYVNASLASANRS